MKKYLSLAVIWSLLFCTVYAQGIRMASLEYRVPSRDNYPGLKPGRSCPATVTVKHHTTDGVSPLDTIIIYEVVQTDVTGSSRCWIAQNLGAAKQATSAIGDSPDSNGWYWQFNHKQAYAKSKSGFIPSFGWCNAIAERSNWNLSKDPCHILLGKAWHIPSKTDWLNASSIGGLRNLTVVFASAIRLNASPYVYFGSETDKCGCTDCLSLWSSTTANDGRYGYTIGVDPTIFSAREYTPKNQGLPVRCIMDL